jgi:choline dehydrogenase-like flavoprotein
MARELIVGKDGKVSAVSYVDKATRSEQRVYARVFVVAASACESARLLLNSRSTLFPDGLANSSGVVGRNLMDTVGSDGGGYFESLERMPAHNHDGVGGMHMYLPWWKYDRKNHFLRGYASVKCLLDSRRQAAIRLLAVCARHPSELNSRSDRRTALAASSRESSSTLKPASCSRLRPHSSV